MGFLGHQPFFFLQMLELRPSEVTSVFPHSAVMWCVLWPVALVKAPPSSMLLLVDLFLLVAALDLCIKSTVCPQNEMPSPKSTARFILHCYAEDGARSFGFVGFFCKLYSHTQMIRDWG